MKLNYFEILFLILTPVVVVAQADTLIAPAVESVPEEIIEDFLQNQGSEAGFEFNTFFEELDLFRSHPIDLNDCTRSDLEALILLSDLQIAALLDYRRVAGEFIALEELQAIPGFDLHTIRKILPYLTINKKGRKAPLTLPFLLKEGSSEAFFRWQRRLQRAKGWTVPQGSEETNRFLGTPDKLYFRYKYAYFNRLSLGLTAEKDAGEEFFTGSNRQGFDFYSAHLFVKDLNHLVKAVALGDFTASFGQGLILYSGFGRGKGADVMSIKRNSRSLYRYSSVDENNFLRGAGVTLNLSRHLEFTAFGSIRNRDANILLPDTLDQEENFFRFSSLQSSGLHRTPGEIADENAIQQLTLGGNLKYQADRWHIALNALADRFDKPLQRRIRPYNQYFFQGDRLSNFSLDYSYIYENFNFFGETARSANGRVATINGILMTLNQWVDLALLHRHFPRDYQALNANPLAETSGANNESGLYIATVFRLNRFWNFSVYFDTWRHPWLRFNADAPSVGSEFRARLTYYKKRHLEAYLEIRNESKQRNAPDPDAPQDYLTDTQLLNARVHFSNKVTASLELRTRLDAGFFDNGLDDKKEKGYALYQDVLFRPITFPLSFSLRYARFNTDGFNIRFYSYENDLVYSFSVPAYYNRGSRFYFNVRYKGFRNLSLELRFAQTYWANQDHFGSGLDRTEGSVRSDIKAQVRFKF